MLVHNGNVVSMLKKRMIEMWGSVHRAAATDTVGKLIRFVNGKQV